ncbi:MAG: hypothetical protein KAW89_04745 [Armatimonadetes bacterium]|nr:hypothetical protein [Armatimonadota bacterium]
MKANMTEPDNKQDNDVRDIPKWIRRYIQHRTVLPGLVFGLLLPLMVFTIFLPARFFERAGSNGLALITGALAVGLWAMGMWFLLTHRRRTGRSIEQALIERVYRREGRVSESEADMKRPPRWLVCLTMVVWALTVLATMTWWQSIPARYWQPLSAVLWVPLLAYLALRGPRARASGSIPLLWPLLYALHAVLILVGLPLYLTGPYEGKTLWLSLMASGVVAALVSHLYSRYALQRLRRLATSPQETGGEQ